MAAPVASFLRCEMLLVLPSCRWRRLAEQWQHPEMPVLAVDPAVRSLGDLLGAKAICPMRGLWGPRGRGGGAVVLATIDDCDRCSSTGISARRRSSIPVGVVTQTVYESARPRDAM